MAGVHAIAEKLGLSVLEVRLCGLDVPSEGEITGRNMMLITAALSLRPSAQGIGLAIHAGTGYRDCSPEFIELAQAVLDFHRHGECRLIAPFVAWSKADVLALARELDVPIERTHSCEAANVACGLCRSCRDREVLLAG